MNLNKLFLTPIKGYQYFSKMFPANCRYYPSCSEYATWQFKFNAPHKALMESSLRILRCNQFFKGGIDYPLVNFMPQKHSSVLTFNPECGTIKIRYWLVPKSTQTDNTYYYIVKDFNATKRST